MTEKELGRFIDDICSYFERRKPNQHTLDLWYEKLQRIPSESLDYIKSNIQSKAEWPKNLPEMTYALFQLWIERNPNKRSRRDVVQCPYCTDGILFLAKHESIYNSWVPVSANCGHCNQRQDEPKIPVMTKFQYEELGYKLWDSSLNEKVELSQIVLDMVGKVPRSKSDINLGQLINQLQKQYEQTQQDEIPF